MSGKQRDANICKHTQKERTEFLVQEGRACSFLLCGHIFVSRDLFTNNTSSGFEVHQWLRPRINIIMY